MGLGIEVTPQMSFTCMNRGFQCEEKTFNLFFELLRISEIESEKKIIQIIIFTGKILSHLSFLFGNKTKLVRFQNKNIWNLSIGR